MKLIYQNKDEKQNAFYRIYIDEQKKYLLISTGGDITQEFHTTTNLKFLEVVEEYKYNSIIFDLSKQKSTQVKSRIWFVSYVTKKAHSILSQNHIYCAVISSSNALEKAVTSIIKNSITSFKPNIHIDFFNPDQLQEAKDWVTHKNNVVSIAE